MMQEDRPRLEEIDYEVFFQEMRFQDLIPGFPEDIEREGTQGSALALGWKLILHGGTNREG